MSDPTPPDTDARPTEDFRVDGLPEPSGGTAKTAAVLSVCCGIFMLAALTLGVARAIIAFGNDEGQFHPIGLIAIAVGLALPVLGIYGGVRLYRREKLGQRLVIAHAVLIFAMVIWICIAEKEFLVLLLGWPVLIFALAVAGATFRWLDHPSSDRPIPPKVLRD